MSVVEGCLISGIGTGAQGTVDAILIDGLNLETGTWTFIVKKAQAFVQDSRFFKQPHVAILTSLLVGYRQFLK